jgi:hypothetical protein
MQYVVDDVGDIIAGQDYLADSDSNSDILLSLPPPPVPPSAQYVVDDVSDISAEQEYLTETDSDSDILLSLPPPPVPPSARSPPGSSGSPHNGFMRLLESRPVELDEQSWPVDLDEQSQPLRVAVATAHEGVQLPHARNEREVESVTSSTCIVGGVVDNERQLSEATTAWMALRSDSRTYEKQRTSSEVTGIASISTRLSTLACQFTTCSPHPYSYSVLLLALASANLTGPTEDVAAQLQESRRKYELQHSKHRSLRRNHGDSSAAASGTCADSWDAMLACFRVRSTSKKAVRELSVDHVTLHATRARLGEALYNVDHPEVTGRSTT